MRKISVRPFSAESILFTHAPTSTRGAIHLRSEALQVFSPTVNSALLRLLEAQLEHALQTRSDMGSPTSAAVTSLNIDRSNACARPR